jgi:hypothetical protein
VEYSIEHSVHARKEDNTLIGFNYLGKCWHNKVQTRSNSETKLF